MAVCRVFLVASAVLIFFAFLGFCRSYLNCTKFRTKGWYVK